MMHQLTGEDGSGDEGPREMLEATVAALEKSGHPTAWGAGCTVRTGAEAAAFATAGYTWYSFVLGGELDSRADKMSPDDLDAAIVALEDSGCLAPEWHANYTDREWALSSGRTLRLADETLARQQPETFRRWLCTAQEMFPFAANGMALAITEEDIHVLPQVGDAELAETFLGDVRGRQLLLATFPDVLRCDRTLRDAVWH